MKKIMKYSRIRIRLNSREEAKLVQEKLFSEGCQWYSGHTEPDYLNAKFLFIDELGRVGKSDVDERYFKEHYYTEIFSFDILLNNYEIF